MINELVMGENNWLYNNNLSVYDSFLMTFFQQKLTPPICIQITVQSNQIKFQHAILKNTIFLQIWKIIRLLYLAGQKKNGANETKALLALK